MQIHRLRITNYRGIEALDCRVSPAGVVAKGGNGRGKTTVLNAIRAALAARDVGADAIHHGAEKAEILVDLEDYTVRRAITANGSTLSVETAAGDVKRKPQTWLSELLGTSPLDPLELFLADAKKRREIVLSALPIKVGPEHVRAWLTPEQREQLPLCFLDRLPDLHGLEAASILHRHFYDRRAALNAEGKNAKAALEHQEIEASKLAGELPEAPRSAEEAAARAGTALELHEDARRRHAQLEAQDRDARELARRTEATRNAIATKRAEAARMREELAAIAVPDLAPLRTAATDADRAVTDAIAALEVAKLRARDAGAALSAALDLADKATQRTREVTHLEAGAAELEATLAATSVPAPSAEDLAGAARAVTEAQAALALARRGEGVAKALEDVARKRKELEGLREQSAALSAVCTKLAKEAPAQLLAESKGIPGLGVAGDEITLDGVRIDALCGAEQMKLAVAIAKRANAKSRILVVDGLERLDPDQLDAFVHEATADGWQLIGSRVDRGELVLEALAVESAEAAQ